MDARQERRARNEALFREVNERIVELENGLTGFDREESQLAGFVCECASGDCGALLELTRGEYEAVRDHPRRFLVLPGHEDEREIEQVIERHAHYFVVEKRGEAAEIAIEQDPRSEA